MSGMTPRQVLADIIKDYRYNVRMGMPIEQSLEVMKAMVVDLIEFEKEKMFDLGQESGRYGLRHQLWIQAIKTGTLKDFEALIEGIEHVEDSLRDPVPTDGD